MARDRVGRGRQSEGSTAETARKRPERPWTVARTMEVLRCPLAIAQRLVHCAIAVLTAVLGQSHKDNRCEHALFQLYSAPEIVTPTHTVDLSINMCTTNPPPLGPSRPVPSSPVWVPVNQLLISILPH